jgi:hypothetical protein
MPPIDVLIKLVIYGVTGIAILLLTIFIFTMVENDCYEKFLERIGVK